jgi:membrane protease YdiL (CAAX protease family)
LFDVVLAIALWVIWFLILRSWDGLFGPGDAASINSLLPEQPIELVLWVVLSISAGFCEEVIFRAYFQKQFAALTRSVWIALFLQAGLFGISHGYQGAAAALKISIFGVLFGVFAWWRKSIRPGIIAHALTDILAVV